MLIYILTGIALWVTEFLQIVIETWQSVFAMIRRKKNSPQIYAFRPYQINRLHYVDCVPPKPRSGHRIVCNDRDIFCFGGFNPDIPSNTGRYRDVSLFQELWRFDTLSRQWELIFGPGEHLPDELASHAMLLLGNSILVSKERLLKTFGSIFLKAISSLLRSSVELAILLANVAQINFISSIL